MYIAQKMPMEVQVRQSISRAAVPNLFGPRDGFRGRPFFHGMGGRWWGGGDVVQAVMWTMGNNGSGRCSFASSPATHLLLHSPVPNRPRTGTGPRPRGWGPCSRGYLALLYFCKNLWLSMVREFWRIFAISSLQTFNFQTGSPWKNLFIVFYEHP